VCKCRAPPQQRKRRTTSGKTRSDKFFRRDAARAKIRRIAKVPMKYGLFVTQRYAICVESTRFARRLQAIS
jgi:hypothetical protein